MHSQRAVKIGIETRCVAYPLSLAYPAALDQRGFPAAFASFLYCNLKAIIGHECHLA